MHVCQTMQTTARNSANVSTTASVCRSAILFASARSHQHRRSAGKSHERHSTKCQHEAGSIRAFSFHPSSARMTNDDRQRPMRGSAWPTSCAGLPLRDARRERPNRYSPNEQHRTEGSKEEGGQQWHEEHGTSPYPSFASRSTRSSAGCERHGSAKRTARHCSATRTGASRLTTQQRNWTNRSPRRTGYWPQIPGCWS